MILSRGWLKYVTVCGKRDLVAQNKKNELMPVDRSTINYVVLKY